MYRVLFWSEKKFCDKSRGVGNCISESQKPSKPASLKSGELAYDEE